MASWPNWQELYDADEGLAREDARGAMGTGRRDEEELLQIFKDQNQHYRKQREVRAIFTKEEVESSRQDIGSCAKGKRLVLFGDSNLRNLNQNVSLATSKSKHFKAKSNGRRGDWIEKKKVKRCCKTKTLFNPCSKLRMLLTLLVIVLLDLAPALPSIRQVDSESTIEVTKFYVPSRVQLNKSTRLICLYQLKGVTLHAMKLFKDNNEFYRYLPPNRSLQREETKLIWPFPGVQVDERRSNATSVVLGPLTKQSAGTYKCQVSIEDTFKSVSVERRMELAAAAPTTTTAAFDANLQNAINNPTAAAAASATSTQSANNQGHWAAGNVVKQQAPSSFFNLQQEPKPSQQSNIQRHSPSRPIAHQQQQQQNNQNHYQNHPYPFDESMMNQHNYAASRLTGSSHHNIQTSYDLVNFILKVGEVTLTIIIGINSIR